MSSALVNDSTSDPAASQVRQRESYLAFQGCSPPETNSFGAVVRFEARPLRDGRAWLHPEWPHHDREHTPPDATRHPPSPPLARPQLLMAVLFCISFSFATKRKRKLLAIQHHRIAQYLS